jgi:hypothetical protein
MRVGIVTAVVVAIACASAGEARAQWGGWEWAVSLDLSSRWASNLADDARAEDVHQGAGGIDLKGLGGRSSLALAAAIDVELGFEVPGGFVYGFHLLPIGVGARLTGRNVIGIVTGGGFGGTVDRVPFAWELPVEAFVELDLGRFVRFLASARMTFTPGTGERDDGAPSIDFADEAELAVGLAFGERYDQYDTRWSDGTYVGFFAREQQGAAILGVTISIHMNGASD